MLSDSAVSALQGVRAARQVERVARGLTREQRRHMGSVVERRILEAVRAGATTTDVAEVLGVSVDGARKRVRRARIEAQPLVAPTVWREVPMCGRSAPPPWPVSARCRQSVRHNGDHVFGR